MKRASKKLKALEAAYKFAWNENDSFGASVFANDAALLARYKKARDDAHAAMMAQAKLEGF